MFSNVNNAFQPKNNCFNFLNLILISKGFVSKYMKWSF